MILKKTTYYIALVGLLTVNMGCELWNRLFNKHSYTEVPSSVIPSTGGATSAKAGAVDAVADDVTTATQGQGEDADLASEKGTEASKRVTKAEEVKKKKKEKKGEVNEDEKGEGDEEIDNPEDKKKAENKPSEEEKKSVPVCEKHLLCAYCGSNQFIKFTNDSETIRCCKEGCYQVKENPCRDCGKACSNLSISRSPACICEYCKKAMCLQGNPPQAKWCCLGKCDEKLKTCGSCETVHGPQYMKCKACDAFL